MALATTADLFASYVNDDLVSWNDPRSQNREFTIWLKDISVLELNDLSQYLTKERIMNKYYAVKYRRQVERMEPTFNSLSDLLKDFLQRPGADVNYKRLQRCPTRDDAIDSFKFFFILLSLLVIKFHLRPLRYFNLLWPKKKIVSIKCYSTHSAMVLCDVRLQVKVYAVFIWVLHSSSC